MPVVPSVAVGPGDAGAHGHDGGVDVEAVAGPGEGGGDRHALDLAAERVAGRERVVEEAERSRRSATRSLKASGRAAPSVIT